MNEKQEVKVKVVDANSTPHKLRLLADLVRGNKVADAKNKLTLINKRAADIVLKAIESGIANAENNFNLSEKDLYIKHISVDEGSKSKRFAIASRSRIANIIKRKAIINLILSAK